VAILPPTSKKLQLLLCHIWQDIHMW